MRYVAGLLVLLAGFPVYGQSALTKQTLTSEQQAEVDAHFRAMNEQQAQRVRDAAPKPVPASELQLEQSARICFWREAAAFAKKTLAQQKSNARRLGMANRTAAYNAQVYMDQSVNEIDDAKQQLSEAGLKPLSCSRRDVKKAVHCIDADSGDPICE